MRHWRFSENRETLYLLYTRPGRLSRSNLLGGSQPSGSSLRVLLAKNLPPLESHVITLRPDDAGKEARVEPASTSTDPPQAISAASGSKWSSRSFWTPTKSGSGRTGKGTDMKNDSAPKPLKPPKMLVVFKLHRPCSYNPGLRNLEFMDLKAIIRGYSPNRIDYSFMQAEKTGTIVLTAHRRRFVGGIIGTNNEQEQLWVNKPTAKGDNTGGDERDSNDIKLIQLYPIAAVVVARGVPQLGIPPPQWAGGYSTHPAVCLNEEYRKTGVGGLLIGYALRQYLPQLVRKNRKVAPTANPPPPVGPPASVTQPSQEPLDHSGDRFLVHVRLDDFNGAGDISRWMQDSRLVGSYNMSKNARVATGWQWNTDEEGAHQDWAAFSDHRLLEETAPVSGKGKSKDRSERLRKLKEVIGIKESRPTTVRMWGVIVD